MSTNKIFCLGDGYAHGHIWPTWPQILQVLLPDYEILTGTGIGAGNEFLIDQLLSFECQNQTVIFQWAQPNRFDKLMQDDTWNELIDSDDVYFANKVATRSGIWWLSSNSQQEKVLEYHNFFVQKNQHVLRLQHQKTLVENYLQNKQCKYWFTSTSELERFCQNHTQSHLRGDQIQPLPIMHFYFIMEQIKPALSLPIDTELATKLQSLIQETTWRPYDPDREEIWAQLCANF